MPDLIRPLKTLLILLALSGAAQALQVVIMDRDLQSTLGAGQSAGGRLTLQLAADASGAVVVFIKDEGGQTQSFTGSLRGGQLTLNGASLAQLLAARGVTLVLPPAPATAPARKKGGGDPPAAGDDSGVGLSISIGVGTDKGNKGRKK